MRKIENFFRSFATHGNMPKKAISGPFLALMFLCQEGNSRRQEDKDPCPTFSPSAVLTFIFSPSPLTLSPPPGPQARPAAHLALLHTPKPALSSLHNST